MNTGPRRYRSGRGFTLVELLVVIVIVLLVSAIALPTILPALSNRQVSEGARILQAALAGARDSAIRANAPRGIRLIPDIMSSQIAPSAGSTYLQMYTYSKMVAIEPAPDISDGFVTFPTVSLLNYPVVGTTSAGASWSNAANNPPAFPFPYPGNPAYTAARGFYLSNPPFTPGSGSMVLIVEEAVYRDNVPPTPNPPTNWFWNVRIGDRFRFGDSGRYYTVVGPMTVANPEFFVNDGPQGTSSLSESYYSGTGVVTAATPEFLFLVNAIDDDNDGYVDNGLDALDEDADGYPDNINEWRETEQWLGSQAIQASNHFTTPPLYPLTGQTFLPKVPPTFSYTIARRPTPVATASEVSLPAGAVIDATTWDSTRERSRLPIDINTGYVDIMLNQSGQVIPTTTYSSPTAATMDSAFYHFWIADRTDVYAPVQANSTTAPVFPALPMPQGVGYGGPNYLRKDRQLVTLFTRTGNLVTNSIESFDPTGTAGGANVPFLNAELGIREAK